MIMYKGLSLKNMTDPNLSGVASDWFHNYRTPFFANDNSGQIQLAAKTGKPFYFESFITSEMVQC